MIILQQTKEITCIGCVFGKERACQRPDEYEDCEQDRDDDGGVDHFIYIKEPENANGI